MPSLKFIIGGDASQFAQAMKAVETSAGKAGNQTMAEFRKAAGEIEKARSAIMEMGGSTKFYDVALQKVNAQMSELERSTMAAKMASDALAQSRAKVALGLGDEADRRAARGIPRGMTETEFDRSKLSGSEVTRETNNATRIAELRAEAEKKVALKSSLTGSEVIRKGAMEDQLRRLRQQMTGGSPEAMAAARKEIQMLVSTRAQAEAHEMKKRGMGMSGGMRAASPMFISAGRDTLTSLASGAPITQVAAQQGPQVLQGLAMMGLKIPWLIAGAWTLAIGGIVGGFMLLRQRVKNLTADLKDFADRAFTVEHIPKYLQKINEIKQAQKDIASAIRSQGEAYASVAEQAQRIADLTKLQFDFERKKLELQKANELAGAKNEKQREEIEKKYANLGLGLNRKERDEQVRQKLMEMGRLKAESDQKLAQAQELTTAPGYISESSEKQREDNLRADRDKARKYFEEQAAKDRATAGMSVISAAPSGVGGPGLLFEDPAKIAQREAAAARLRENQASIDRFKEFQDTGDDRKRQRDRAKELQDQAKSADVAAKKIFDEVNPMNPTGLLARNAVANKQESDLQKIADQKKKTGGSAAGGYSPELTGNQKVGAFASGPSMQLDIAKASDAKLAQIVRNTMPGNGTPNFTIGGKRVFK